MQVVFNKLPSNLSELQACEYADLSKPEYTAALFMAAVKVYSTDKNEAFAMIQHLMGPRQLSNYEKHFISDRLSNRDKAQYLADSFFLGSSVENNYKPSEPYTIEITQDSNSYANEGYAKLFIKSSGADSARPIVLRHKPSTNQWFMWEQFLMSDIRQPAALDPWA